MLLAVVDDICEEIVREACAGADRQPCNHREDGCKCHGADKGEENFATQFSSELGSCHVCSSVGCDIVRPHEAGSAEAEEGRHDIEEADDDHGPDDTGTRGLGVGHGVESNEDVRQSRCAEEESHAERNLIPRIFKNQTGGEKVAHNFFSIGAGGGYGGERGKEFADVELILAKHKHRQERAATH